MWKGEVLKAFLLRHRFNIDYIGQLNQNIPRSSGVARSSDRLVNVAWVVLHCNCRIGAREWRQLIPHVRFQVRTSSVVSGWTWCWGLNLKVLWLKAFLSGVGRYWVRRSFWCFATAKKSSTFRLLFFARGLSVTFRVYGCFAGFFWVR